MGYGYYTLSDGREAGYNVEAECDREGCKTRIDRGLGYLCGQQPDGWRSDGDPGCGNYFCGEHTHSHDCPNPNGMDEDGSQKPHIEDGWLAKMRAKHNGAPDPDDCERVVWHNGTVTFHYGDNREPWLYPEKVEMKA